ncbi:pyrophosphatase PpaX [Evansella caseinilytica]|uniref:Pyrophosphatase PpaX n=1 Tax=Evansella caseinilytica TaxID=1503961 RepID=A0A1H3SA85_9BACI|nr:pyrophosphatase PpaX [Evansella caseinilytica]SDZ34465.1 pyrophosphatase PpaX [Evansella caseinilytica]
MSNNIEVTKQEPDLRHVDTILFDLDGTLINTIELIIASFLHTMETYYPGKYRREDVVSFIGPPLSETFMNLDPSKVDEMTKTYRAFNHEKHDELVKEYKGVLATIEQLHEHGYKMAIVTTKRRDTAVRGLKLMEMDKYFDVVITLDEVENYKPHPEPLERAMEALHSVPEKTLMIGDSRHDIIGGKNAGTLTAGVAWSIQGKEKLQSYHPDMMLETMPELLMYLGMPPLTEK